MRRKKHIYDISRGEAYLWVVSLPQMSIYGCCISSRSIAVLPGLFASWQGGGQGISVLALCYLFPVSCAFRVCSARERELRLY